MDAESLNLLRRTAADEAGLPEQLRGCLAGESIGALRQDARALALDLGYVEPQRRTGGQFASFSDQIRLAAGRTPATPAEAPVGDLGIGQGASARERPRNPPDMNSLIRGVHAGRRSVAHQLAEQIAADGAG